LVALGDRTDLGSGRFSGMGLFVGVDD
jgi:hypothetical protein